MDNALGLYQHMDAVQFHIKKPFRLDHLQPLIDHGSGIHRDLRSHKPVRVSQCLFYRDIFQFLPGTVPEGSAGGGEIDCLDLPFLLAIQTLEDSGMFAVNGQYSYIIFLCHRHNDMSRRHKGLFISKGDVLSCPDRLHHRTQPDHSHHGRHYHLHPGQGTDPDKSVHAEQNLTVRKGDSASQFLRIPLISHNDIGWPELPDQFRHLLDIFTCRQRHNFKILRITAYHIQRLGTNGAGSSKYRDSFHVLLHSIEIKYRKPAQEDNRQRALQISHYQTDPAHRRGRESDCHNP